MVAHRGVSGLEKENTNSAFVAAGNRSYYGVETDVHRTADGNFIIIHDISTKRVGLDDLNVEESTFATLRRLTLLDTNNVKDRADLCLPSLEEYILICKKYEKYCVLELKSNYTAAELREMIEIIKKLNYLDHVIFIAFGLDNLIYLRKILPEQPAQYLTSKYDESILEALETYHLDLDIYYPVLTKEIIDSLHAKGIKVNCWTVDNPADGERLAEWGVDYITSNILE
jgi:glycerophosphoryl diester phosphodiesterase